MRSTRGGRSEPPTCHGPDTLSPPYARWPEPSVSETRHRQADGTCLVTSAPFEPIAQHSTLQMPVKRVPGPLLILTAGVSRFQMDGWFIHTAWRASPRRLWIPAVDLSRCGSDARSAGAGPLEPIGRATRGPSAAVAARSRPAAGRADGACPTLHAIRPEFAASDCQCRPRPRCGNR